MVTPFSLSRRTRRAFPLAVTSRSLACLLALAPLAAGCGSGTSETSEPVTETAGGAAGEAGAAGKASAGASGKGSSGASGKGSSGASGAGNGQGGAAGMGHGGAGAGGAGQAGQGGASGGGQAQGGAGQSQGGAGTGGGGAGNGQGGAGNGQGGAGQAGAAQGGAGTGGGGEGGAGNGQGGAGNGQGGAGAGGGGEGGQGGAAAGAGGAAPMATKIKHVVLIVQENHTFDVHFGRYCQAPAGSNPSCTEGPACCEAAPDMEPSGSPPSVLDDDLNANHDPDHSRDCEWSEMHGGLMDRYATGAKCSDPRNFAISDEAVIKPYHDYASQYALADRYFQPIVGATASNNMYLAIAKFQFTDNDLAPDTVGKGCGLPMKTTLFEGRTTLGDILLSASQKFHVYAGGYDAMIKSAFCPAAPSDCPFGLPIPPCVYQPDDIPYQYYSQFADNPTFIRDYTDFAKDIANQTLPALSYIKAVQYRNEHPGYKTKLSQGVAFVQETIDAVQSSSYADDTLILLTWDEGGGFFDHITPPGVSPVDDQPYGTRVPMLAIGPFARSNHVSHVELEHSSIVKFIELNFTGQTGQLGGRDTVVHNIGSLLDPAKTGIVIPED
jgi:phospholipase C